MKAERCYDCLEARFFQSVDGANFRIERQLGSSAIFTLNKEHDFI